MHQGKTKKIVYKTAIHIILIILSLTMLVPFLWMISSSLKTTQEMFASPPTWIPRYVAWENYTYMLQAAPWFKYFANTFFISVLTIIGQLVTCSMAAYAFARLRFKGRNLIFLIYLGTMMIPFQVVMIPQFKIVKLLEEAAKIDGCGYPRIFWEIVIKNSKPAIITLVVFTFMNTWNDFQRPLIFLNDDSLWTLSMGLAKFQGTYVTQWNQMMAGALITMVPVLILYIFAQKYFVQGIVMSGLKE